MAGVHDVLLYLHLAGVFAFLLAHGTAAAVGMRLRRERDPGRVAAHLELSGSTLGAMGIGWILVLATGIGLGVETALTIGLFGAWFYVSIIVYILVTFLMTPLSRGYMKARAALGVKPPMVSAKGWERTLAKGYSREKLGEYLAESKPWGSAAVGFGGVLILTYLMMFKPF
jgi:amino acid transporter